MRGPDPSWSVALDSDTLSVSFTLLAGLDINQLDGWDVTKLGWVKATAARMRLSPPARSSSPPRCVLSLC